MDEAALAQHIEKIRLKCAHVSVTLIIRILLRCFQAKPGTHHKPLPLVRALWHYKMCPFGTSSGKPNQDFDVRAGRRQGVYGDDANDTRSDERHLARRGRSRHDRNRWTDCPAFRPVGLPSL